MAKTDENAPGGAGEALARGLQALGLAALGAEREKLWLYVGELQKWNPLFGFVGRRHEDAAREIVIRHILDSLAGLGPIRAILAEIRARRGEASLADIGSGAGLPGIPLAVFLPQTPVTLVEPSQKRCAFLRSAAALMGLENVKVFEGDIALARREFGVVTFRAFRPLEKKILKKLLALASPGGCIAAYKARAEKTEGEIAAARELGHEARAETLSVPFLGEERRLVLINRKAGGPI
jgi:16S rRNA (guanine527-N7)-methyltransferase